ncbi:hypothetical protein F5X99DRAFT_365247 [Biscogniauxia marginata]|nr:hypothetical protein F5X99DRAFT_365247 [Biscogniauxia marginata]
MSSSYESSRSRRGVWGHWVPLVVTVTVATIGVAAWAWSQRKNDEDPVELDYDNADYGDNTDYGDHPSYGATRDVPQITGGATATNPSLPRDDVSYGVGEVHPEASGLSAGWGSHMSGALGRTSSPQQFLANAGKTVAAGMAGVGAAVGSALAAIREEDRTIYADHETWSEEAEARREKTSTPPQQPRTRRRTVAVVVSADTNLEEFDEDGFHEHASVLSYIPRNTDFSKIKLFVLIYSPGLKDSGLEAAVHTPAEEKESPILNSNSANAAFNAVYSQALTLVEKESMVLPFTSTNGHVHILRHLQPQVVYLQESLAGEDGSVVNQLQTWLRYDVILVVGAEGGHGGLVDNEEEEEQKKDLWWHKEERVGRGRGVIVVDSVRVGDDWARRVQGRE